MTDFIDAVAERAGLAADDVRATLARHGVQTYTPRGTAAKLRLTRVWFSGFKKPDDDPPGEPFEFEWELRDGVQALASIRNSAGKTSVLEICRWMLTGRDKHAVGGLDPRVRAMLQRVRLELNLGTEPVVIEVDAGDEHALGRVETGDQTMAFTAGTMTDVVGPLMLDRLRLQPLAQFTHPGGSARGSVAEHGWPLLSGALVVGPSHLEAVIGTVQNEAGRMLQVYLALPWYETLNQARTARRSVTQLIGDRRNAAQAETVARQTYTTRLENALQRAEMELRALPDEQAMVAAMGTAVETAAERNRELARLEEQLTSASADYEQARDVSMQARRELLAAKEHEVASVFFRSLQPSICPRCDAPITGERIQAEAEDHTCSVCTRQHELEYDGTSIAIAEESVELTESAADAASQRFGELRDAVEESRRARERAHAHVRELALRRDTGVRQAKALEVERLRGRLEERGEAEALVDRPAESDPDLAALAAAADEADARVRQQDDLLGSLNDRILSLGRRFGVSEMTAVKLDRGAHLPVWKGQTRYNYRALSEGDQLRLKVAVVVALLQIGEERGLGHHPGLLMVDSPGAQEVGAEPLQAMLEALDEVAKQQSLQVIVATARRDEALAALGATRVRQPVPEDETLW